MTYPITELFAWIVDDPTEKHGIVALHLMGMPAQAVTSKAHVADLMRPDIEVIAQLAGRPVKLQRFVLAETMVEIK